MKINKKIVFIAAAIVIVMLILCIVTCSAVKKPVIAFYGLDKSQVDGFEQVLVSSAKNAKSNSFRFVVLDGSKPLGKQAKSADLLFIMNGRAASSAAAKLEKKHTGLAPSALDSATSSIRGLAVKAKDGKLISVPVLSDHFEIDIDTELLHESGIKTVATCKDIEKYARAVQKKVKYPISFPGSDGVFMTSLVGAVGEAFNGTQAYDKALEAASSAGGQTAAIDGVAAVKTMTDGETAPLYEGARRSSPRPVRKAPSPSQPTWQDAEPTSSSAATLSSVRKSALAPTPRRNSTTKHIKLKRSSGSGTTRKSRTSEASTSSARSAMSRAA